ncbi:hypothetical protein Bbelb_096020 [Branchiostoma belcheri]|nr:hypothetical protein Bbelb_096020 [Branchiostoma belcheri]
MEAKASAGFDSMYNAFRSLEVLNSGLSRGLQMAYLVLSLVVAVGGGLLLIYLVCKKEYLRKPRHYLRCNLAVDDIIFTTCIITTETRALKLQTIASKNNYYRLSFFPRTIKEWNELEPSVAEAKSISHEDDANDQRFCAVQVLVVHPFTISMFGTYLFMAVELYYFICKPLHYNGEVTTKRVFVGIMAVRAIAIIFGIGPLVVKRLQSSEGGDSMRCGPEPIGSTSASAVFRSVGQGGIVLAVLAAFLLYFFVLKEARKQQEREKNRDLWLCQTKAFRTMAPHAIVVIVSAATLAFVSASFRSLFNGDGRKATASLLVTAQVAKLLNITVSSMVNPIVYSFRRPEFRRALRELCSRPPTDAPVALGMETAVFSLHITSTSAPTTPQGERQQGGEGPNSPDQTQATRQAETPPQDLVPLPGQCTQQTPKANRPAVLTIQAEVHNSPQHHGQKPGPPEQHRQKIEANSSSMPDTPMDEKLTSIQIHVDDSEMPNSRPDATPTQYLQTLSQ